MNALVNGKFCYRTSEHLVFNPAKRKLGYFNYFNSRLQQTEVLISYCGKNATLCHSKNFVSLCDAANLLYLDDYMH